MKHPAAVALGSIRTAKKAAASARTGRLYGGRPSLYRMTPAGLERRDGDRWLLLDPPYSPAARQYLRRHR